LVAKIEYIEKVIATYGEAAEANLQTPGREGNVVVITAEEADDVMITADLHGNRPNFNSIKKIADLDNQPRRHLILQEVCHGGPVYPTSGGCMSHTMLEDVARMKVTFPDRVHFIISNHELAEMTDYPIVKGEKMLNLQFRFGLQEMYGPATEKVREAYLAFLRSCPLAVRMPGDVLACHSTPEKLEEVDFDPTIFTRELEPADMEQGGSLFSMVWGRDYRPENARRFAQLVGAQVLIHGHEPCPEGCKVPNDVQIILDCCGRPATYLILPTGEQLDHAQIAERIERLP
jgi:hypothetical protein